MPIYVDPLFNCAKSDKWPYSQACHMTADTTEELHAFAEKLGLKRSWFQCHHKNVAMHHYDLTPNKRRQAVRLGAKEITWEERADLVKKAYGYKAPREQRTEGDLDREILGQLVRSVWIAWAKEQSDPKPSWLVEWDGLSEPDKEVDRRIGEAVARFVLERQEDLSC